MKYHYYYTMEYLPTRYQANESEWDNRHAVWDFKDGYCRNSILNDMVNIVNKIACGSKLDYVICFIPASTRRKTTNRFSDVARKLIERTGIEATLSAIEKPFDSAPEHIGGKSDNPTEGFNFNASLFKGKNVILVDDVITRGRTFFDAAEKLRSHGAISVTGLFVAKTVNPDFC